MLDRQSLSALSRRPRSGVRGIGPGSARFQIRLPGNHRHDERPRRRSRSAGPLHRVQRGVPRRVRPDLRGRAEGRRQHDGRALAPPARPDERVRHRPAGSPRRRVHPPRGVRGRAARAELYEIRCTPLRDRRGRLIGAAYALRDVTEKHRVDEALREANATLERRVAERTAALAESEERFRAAIDHFPGTFAIYDTDRRLQFVNATGLARAAGARTSSSDDARRTSSGRTSSPPTCRCEAGLRDRRDPASGVESSGTVRRSDVHRDLRPTEGRPGPHAAGARDRGGDHGAKAR